MRPPQHTHQADPGGVTVHQNLPCTVCHQRMWTASPGRRCAMTPDCPGTHGRVAKQKPTRKKEPK